MAEQAHSIWLKADVDGFDTLVDLALNLRWSWSHGEEELWEPLDAELWELTHNPWLVRINLGEVIGSISEAIMNRLKRILRPYNAVLLVLFAGFLLPVSAQSGELESLIISAKGHGKVSSVVDERKITSALVVLRQNGSVLITVTAELQLQAQGTWKATASSPEEILLKITGGVLKGEMTGSGKLLLTSDRKSFKELTIKVKLSDGQEVTVTFIAEAPEPSKSRI